MKAEPLLRIEGLSIDLHTRSGVLHAVSDLEYSVRAGETLGIVGETGSGKTTHILALLGLLPVMGRVIAGKATFMGRDLLSLSQQALRDIRGRDIGMVFQDPMSSLNPVLTVGRQIAEPLMRHKRLSRKQAMAQAVDILAAVGIPDPALRVTQFPFQLSGGMRQRVMIAIAIACEPRLLVADEPTTALDVTVQAQIITLIKELQARMGMAVIWISHDLGVVARVADTVQVMYAGRILERGPVRSIFKDHRNAYTWSLLKSSTATQAPGTRLFQMGGLAPDLRQDIAGDPFASRNPFATERCFIQSPPLTQVIGGAPGHLNASWYDLHSVLADREIGR